MCVLLVPDHDRGCRSGLDAHIQLQATTLSEEHERELKKIFDDYDQVQK